MPQIEQWMHDAAREIVKRHLGYEHAERVIASAYEKAHAPATPATLDLLREFKDFLFLVTQKAPGYDWNADPLYFTLKIGDLCQKIDAANTLRAPKITSHGTNGQSAKDADAIKSGVQIADSGQSGNVSKQVAEAAPTTPDRDDVMQGEYAKASELRHIEWDDWELAFTLGWNRALPSPPAGQGSVSALTEALTRISDIVNCGDDMNDQQREIYNVAELAIVGERLPRTVTPQEKKSGTQ